MQPRRVVSETVSGSMAAMARWGFARLVDRLKEGDVLVVTKLDRLGAQRPWTWPRPWGRWPP